MMIFFIFKGEVAYVELNVDNRDAPEDGRYYFCFDNGDGEDDTLDWVHAGNQSFQSVYFIEKKRATILDLPLQIFLLSILLCLSGTFSGLNLVSTHFFKFGIHAAKLFEF